MKFFTETFAKKHYGKNYFDKWLFHPYLIPVGCAAFVLRTRSHFTCKQHSLSPSIFGESLTMQRRRAVSTKYTEVSNGVREGSLDSGNGHHVTTADCVKRGVDWWAKPRVV